MLQWMLTGVCFWLISMSGPLPAISCSSYNSCKSKSVRPTQPAHRNQGCGMVGSSSFGVCASASAALNCCGFCRDFRGRLAGPSVHLNASALLAQLLLKLRVFFSSTSRSSHSLHQQIIGLWVFDRRSRSFHQPKMHHNPMCLHGPLPSLQAPLRSQRRRTPARLCCTAY
jgi:hypothetical protein